MYPQLEETLKNLSARFPLFIVSNCQAGYIEVFLQATGFGHYFKGHLCPGDTGMAKAENIMKIRDDFDLKDPVYVGDTLGDFNACRKADIPFIFAEYGSEKWKLLTTVSLPRQILWSFADNHEKNEIY